MKYKIEEQELNDKVFFVTRGYASYFFIYGENIQDKKFNAFRIDKFEENDKSGVVIEVNNNFLEIAKMIFSNYDGENIYAYIEKYQEFFERNREWIDILKLRGDFAELLFLKEVGGSKLDDSQIYDIKYKDEYIEVKSYSNKNKRVIISNEQLGNNSTKAVVEIRLDSTGVDILSLSKMIPFNNVFKEYINEKYSKDIYSNYKFSVEKPRKWSSPEKVELIEPIISGKFSVNILEKDLSNFK